MPLLIGCVTLPQKVWITLVPEVQNGQVYCKTRPFHQDEVRVHTIESRSNADVRIRL
jgi:hypothetical protein